MTASATRHEARAARTIRDIRRDETAALLGSDIAQAAIALHGTPVLLLDPERVRRQYRRLTAALPFVRFHYAVKALSHDAVIAALADEGCGFDVATGEELALLEGIDARAHHPHAPDQEGLRDRRCDRRGRAHVRRSTTRSSWTSSPALRTTCGC